MKTIGMIGGTTWASTKEYYTIINKEVNKKLGKTHSAECILYSIDFEETMTKNWNNWKEIEKRFIKIANILEISGADLLIICANTPHKIADKIIENMKIPLIHIADTTGEKIKEKDLKKVGLLGTKYTMNEDFIKKILKDKYNIEVIVPKEKDQEIIENIIFNELSHEIIKEKSKQKFKKIIEKLISKNAQGIILGCTEIPLLIKQEDFDLPIFDTTNIHAKAAVKFALKK